MSARDELFLRLPDSLWLSERDGLLDAYRAEVLAEADAPIVWVLDKGEFGEGGNVLGIFADKELAKGAFIETARSMPFDIDSAVQDEDGTIRLSAGCDYLHLTPHRLVVRPAIEGGAS